MASIGAIAVAPSDPNIVYVGTGEADIRGDISYGDGVYKSSDGGQTWKHMGLEATRRIGALIVDPKDPNRVFVAALGNVFGPSPQRGVYRSLDGGQTWQKVLYVNERTGAMDIVFDPRNGRILYAAMWQASRTPWAMTSGGPGSGLYKSTDGGATWSRLSGHGLPGGVLGKIGVAVSGADPNRVYALIEAKKGGLYVSDNAGKSWRLVNAKDQLRQRAWYFTDVYADPKAVDTVYVLNTAMLRSTDGGVEFKSVRAPHGDNHDLWIDPTDPARMINGNDGGATITENGGRTWSTLDNQPTAEFYHVATDQRYPFYVYGAQQDNSTVAIASSTDSGVITTKDWYQVGGGESGWVVPEPGDPNIVFAGSYDGLITRYDRASGQEEDINPWPDNPMGAAAAGLKYRFQWTAPILISPFPPHALFFGANVLFKSINQGQSWTVISPDLTRDDKAKQVSSGGPIEQDNTSSEYYDTIFCLAASPLQRGILWAGSDDGLVHVTRDGGRHWANVTPPMLPPWTKISIIEAGHFAPGAAFVAANGEKNNDFHPYIYKTTDFGRTWTPIVHGLPPDVYVHVVRQEPVSHGLLFAGTEQGVYYSLNDGADWHSLQLNLPTTSVRDIAVHGSDLVIATHGRAFWILDDITPLRQYQPAIAAQAVHLYQPRAAYRSRSGGFFRHLAGVGQGAPAGAIVDYWLKEKPQGAVALKILDAQGRVVAVFSSAKKRAPAGAGSAAFRRGPRLPSYAGLNRFIWNERYPRPRPIPGIGHWGFAQGVLAPPGHYQVQLTAAGHTFDARLEIRPDPRVHASAADYQQQFALAQKIVAQINAIDDAVNQMRAVRKQLAALDHRLA
ncbi:MAG: WD40/YVTN/BNR-like repeat-containing protein, partial [Terriglobales bacterium]